ncbi:MAG: SLC13 family permease [Bacteroidota bacterium]
MNLTTSIILVNALLSIGLQGVFRNMRHIIIASGATAALLISTTGAFGLDEFFRLLPLDVLAILLSLQLFGEVVVESKVFEVLTRKLAVAGQGKGWLIIIVFSLVTYTVSCFMDNYQCLLLLIPPMIGTLRQINTSKRFLQILFGMLVVSSNLGGASTPIGDFPALYMLSKGVITFKSYLLCTSPLLLVSIGLCLSTALLFYSFKPLLTTHDEEITSVVLTKALYRNVKINQKVLLPSLFIFLGMVFCWTSGFNATKVSIGGFLVLALCINYGRTAEEKIKKTEAGIFIYYLCLFVIVVSIQQTGLLNRLADFLLGFKSNKVLMLIMFVSVTTIVTGVVSAGPSTVAMFPVVEILNPMFPENMVLSCFVLSICAGSSLLMTSATAGPLMANLSEQFHVEADGKKYAYNFRDYLLPGFTGAFIIYSVNISYILIKLY